MLSQGCVRVLPPSGLQSGCGDAHSLVSCPVHWTLAGSVRWDSNSEQRTDNLLLFSDFAATDGSFLIGLSLLLPSVVEHGQYGEYGWTMLHHLAFPSHQNTTRKGQKRGRNYANTNLVQAGAYIEPPNGNACCRHIYLSIYVREPVKPPTTPTAESVENFHKKKSKKRLKKNMCLKCILRYFKPL